MDEQGGQAAAFPMEPGKAPEIHIQHQVPHQKQEVLSQVLLQVIQGSGCSQRLLFAEIADPHPKAAAVSEIFPDGLPPVADDQKDLLDAVFPQALDLISQHRFAQDRHHGLRQVP